MMTWLLRKIGPPDAEIIIFFCETWRIGNRFDKMRSLRLFLKKSYG